MNPTHANDSRSATVSSTETVTRTTRAGRAALIPFAALALAAAVACGGSNDKPAEAPPPPPPSATPTDVAVPDAGGTTTTDTTPAPSASAAAPAAPTPPVSTKGAPKTDASWQACHKDFKPKSKDLAKEVHALGKACAAASKMKPMGKLITGTQSDSGGPQTFPLKAEAKHCYRVYAQGSDGIKDLDVGLRDSTGTVVGEDATDSSTAVVLEDGAICFSESDSATIVVAVGMGSGTYALQVWSD